MAKKALILTFLVGFLGFAVWQKLQILAIVLVIAALCLLFTPKARKFTELIYDLLRDARQAKYGDFEIQLGRNLKDFSNLTVQKAVGIQMVLSQLTPLHVSLLLAVDAAGRYYPNRSMKEPLRELRARGLILHDEASMEAATEVWLTPFGTEVAGVLKEVPVATNVSGPSAE